MTDAISRRPALATAAQARRERQFRAARRHSAFVRVLRWGVPAATVAAAGLFGASYVLSARLGVNVESVSVSVDSARLTREGLVMDRPRVTGATAGGQRFEVRAAKAWQNPANPKLVNFTLVEAEMGLKDGGATALTAQEGVYDSERETLTVQGDVRVRSSEGYQAQAQSAFVDFAAGLVRTERSVMIENEDMRLEASAATALGAEQKVEFIGPVRMIIRAKAPDH